LPAPANEEPPATDVPPAPEYVSSEDPMRDRTELGDDQLLLPGKIRFQQGAAEWLAESGPILDGVAETLMADQNLVVEIGVHTDASGSSAFNRALSQVRADRVRQYLIDQGVADEQLTAVGYGEERPIPGATPEALSRVEFVIVGR
jgi:outer membrane protein OmpA-like peptidoglycan-associated protein